ncbi:MAG: rod shape-determining protein MreD [candidate division NC10 bacterium]|nr:rod shape-determining protein MreD [candidate division NC10 bacterium]
MTPFVLFLGVAVFQSTLLYQLSIGGVKPDLFLLLLFFLSLSLEADLASFLGLLFGLSQDALSGGPLGLKVFSLSLMGFLTAHFSEKLYTTAILPRFMLLALIAVLSGTTTLLLLRFFLDLDPLLPTFLRIVLPEALLTTVVGLLVLVFLKMRGALEVKP